MDRDRLRRSRLYLPGNEPKFYVNAGLHEPDGVILDLEDSVAPDDKPEARKNIIQAIGDVDVKNRHRTVQVYKVLGEI